MLNYLTGLTRPDLAFAAYQCARFSEDPNALHELAVRQISKLANIFLEQKTEV